MTNVSPLVLVRWMNSFVCYCGRWHLNVSVMSSAILPNPWLSLSYLFQCLNFHFLDICCFNMQRHFQIHLKTNDICLFVVARDDISIYQRLPVRVHNSPFLWPSPSDLCRNTTISKPQLFLYVAPIYTQLYSQYSCWYLMKLNSLDKRRCFWTSNM